MFEYLYFRDLGIQIVLWISIVLLLSSFKYKIKNVFLYSTIIVITQALLWNFYLSYVYDENIELFNKNKKLECHVNKSKYLVEKSNGFSIQKHYFVKDQLLILIVNCEEF